MTQKIVVVDLDGTLCNSKHREHLAVAGQWDEFHSLLADDEPWSDVHRLLRYFVDDEQIVGLTGRNEKHRPATLKWLYHHGIILDQLLMRPEFDPRPDHELKPQLLAEVCKPEEVWFILEDRDKVVEAWRNLGYNCWQVRPGGY